MSQSRKILLFAGGAYLLLVVLAFILFGNVGRQEFVPQEEFELRRGSSSVRSTSTRRFCTWSSPGS
jgi:hypothetical protein